MYKQIINSQGQLSNNMILRVAGNLYIPFDPANTDYIAYLAWLAEGNTPEPADEVTG